MPISAKAQWYKFQKGIKSHYFEGSIFFQHKWFHSFHNATFNDGTFIFLYKFYCAEKMFFSYNGIIVVKERLCATSYIIDSI